jgi:type II secretory pathway pseudopilin PulG
LSYLVFEASTMSQVLSRVRQHLSCMGWLLLKGQPLGQQPPRPTEQGVTIIECLAAIAVMVITITLMTPPLVVATATRVRNQRSEQAFQLAQGEIDRIRTLVVRGNHTVENLPNISTSANIQATPAPTALLNAELESPKDGCDTFVANRNGTTAPDKAAPNQLIRVDVDGKPDCQPEFLMQVFRSAGSTTVSEASRGNNAKPDEFMVGVRVYWIGAQANLNSLKTDAVSLGLTGGVGKQDTSPLVVLYMPVSWGETNTSVCGYYQRAGETQKAKELCGGSNIY